ncbi:MAG: hypothetical protein AAF517_19685, partial [Planctomycetota bacterium]
MRDQLRRLVSTLFIVCSAAATAADESATQLRAGASRVDISPAKLPVLQNGGFLEAQASRVITPLHARALALESGGERLVLVVVD